MATLKDILAERRQHCPLCQNVREHPENWFGKVMALCDSLKDRLREAQATQVHLADAVVEQAVAG